MDNEAPNRFYHGISMLGTFQQGDYLHSKPLSLETLHPGDVILYHGLNWKGEEDEIVHRVMSIEINGAVTKGDNNPFCDNGLVTAEALIGKVTHFERNGLLRRVNNGRSGLVQARLVIIRCQVKRLAWRVARGLLGWVYRWLRRSGLIRRLWQPVLVKVRVLKEDGSFLVKYVYKGKTVAAWQPEIGWWLCKKPFDLVLEDPRESI
jgi:signal peptidase I